MDGKTVKRDRKLKKKIDEISHDDKKIGVILAITAGFVLLYNFRSKRR